MKLTSNLRDAFVRAALADVPSVDYSEKIRDAVTKDAVAQLPAKVRALWANSETRSFLGLVHWGAVGVSVQVPGVRPLTLSPDVQSAVSEMLAKKKEQEATLKNLHTKIKAAADSVTTREALVKALPEFEKYLPVDQTAALRNAPALANIAADFVKAGWPKKAIKPAQ